MIRKITIFIMYVFLMSVPIDDLEAATIHIERQVKSCF